MGGTVPVSVVLAYLHNGKVHGGFMRSVINLLIFDEAHGRHIYTGGHLGLPSGPNLSAPRCQVVRSFLETEGEWLWFVDSDMTFEPDILERLVEVADPDTAPIVGGLCFGQIVDHGVVLYYPTMFMIDDEGQGWRVDEYPPDTVFDVHATGTACLLIHRRVLEAMAAKFPEPLPWFAEEVSEWGGLQSEDVTFCRRARSLGFPVKVHTGVKTGHLKMYEITEEMHRASYEAWLAAHG